MKLDKVTKKILLIHYSLLLLLLPFAYSRHVLEIFELNKFLLLMLFTGFVSIFFSFGVLSRDISIPKIQIKSNKEKLKIFSIILIFALVAFFIISTFLSLSPWESLFGANFHYNGLITFLCVFLLISIIFALNINKNEILKFIFFPIIIAGLLQSFILIIQEFSPDYFNFGLDLGKVAKRNFGTFGQANFTARFLLFPLSIVLPFLFNRHKGKFNFILIFLTTIIIFSGILLTDSRAGILGALLCLFLVFNLKLFKDKNIWMILVLNLVFVLISLSFFLLFRDKFLERGNELNTRIYILRNAPELITKTPLLGFGLETQEIPLSQIKDKELFLFSKSSTLDRAHNEFLDIYLQLGIFGAFTYFLLILTLLLGSLKKLKEPIFQGAFIAIISSLFARQFGFFSNIEIFLFFLFLFLISINFKNKEIKINESKLTWKKISIVLVSLSTSVLLLIFLSLLFNSQRLFLEGKKQKNISLLEKADKTFPFNKNLKKELFIEFMKKGYLNKAQAVSKRTEKLFPNWHMNHYFEAELSLKNGNKQEAKKHIENALSLFPENLIYLEFLEILRLPTDFLVPNEVY